LLAIPVAVIALLVGQSGLKRRVGDLESRIRHLNEQVARLRQVADPRAGVGPWSAAVSLPKGIAGEKAALPARAEDATLANQPDTKTSIPGTAQVKKGGTETAAPGLDAPVPPERAFPDRQDQDRPLVIRRDRVAGLLVWMRTNWVYMISAASLALAGVFFVQYGIENGLLPPPVRVLLAVLLGLVLIIAGEWIGRRQAQGGAAAGAAMYLPEVFSGAGLVSMFAGLVAGRQMYEIYGPETAFAGLAATSALAVLLGWRNGPFLAAIGLLGAALTPFLVSSGDDSAPWLYAFYLMIAMTGLAVDAVRRWAWVSVLALVLGYGGGFLMYQAGAGNEGWIALLMALAVAAVALPVQRLVPDHEGPTVAETLFRVGMGPWPPFPVRLAAGAALATTGALTVQLDGGAAASLLAFGALALLALAYLLWAGRAPGLDDLAVLPALGLLARIASEGAYPGPLALEFRTQLIGLRLPETSPPWSVTGLLSMAALITLAFGWRATADTRRRPAFGLAAVGVAPLAALLLELLWDPAAVLGAYGWALHVMAVAALMVLLALRFSRADGADRRRTAYATIAALSLIAMSLFLLTSAAALTLALAALVLAAAALDRRFDLPELGWFLQLGVAVLGWRIMVDPGLDWALSAPQPGVSLTFAGVIGAMAGSHLLLRPRDRVLPKGVLESAAAGFAALFANVLITRWLGHSQPLGWQNSALDWTLNALPWLILMLVQVYRMPMEGALRRLRAMIALAAGVAAAGGLFAAVSIGNPLFARDAFASGALVRGPMLLDTLLVAYGVPGLILLAAAWRMQGPGRTLRLGFAVAGALLVALYVGLEIRRFWQGDFLGGGTVSQPELYSYTVAMMAVGAALLYQAIARRSVLLRRAAMAVIAVTVAKVFLLDASGLTGLTRVVSFLGLGVSLAGLAWLNRWAGGGDAGRPEG
jgi:uncharacterized membrane protein